MLERLEGEKLRIEAELSDVTLYQGPAQGLQQHLRRLQALTQELESGYARWSELEALGGQTLKP
jgi:hypothetical protein